LLILNENSFRSFHLGQSKSTLAADEIRMSGEREYCRGIAKK
jgi:hypothetical protein